MLNEQTLERYMQIAQDIKKEFGYSKSTGKWYWNDRDERVYGVRPFPTFWAALCDAVEPYVEESD